MKEIPLTCYSHRFRKDITSIKSPISFRIDVLLKLFRFSDIGQDIDKHTDRCRRELRCRISF